MTTSLAILKMQTKTTHLSEWLKLKSLTISADKDTGRLEPSVIADGDA